MLVSWSPAWCCCGIRMGLDRVAGEVVVEGGARGAIGEASGPRCPRCREAMLERAGAGGAGRDGTLASVSTLDGDDRSAPTRVCGCHDHGRELLPAAESTIPPLTLATQPMVVIAIVANVDDAGPTDPRGHAHERGQPPPRVETLLDLGCRLTV